MKHPVVFVTPGRNGRIDPGWLGRARRSIGGEWYAGPERAEDVGLEALDAGDESLEAVRRAFTGRIGGGRWLLVLRAGLETPDDFVARINRALESPGCPEVLLPAGNYAPALDQGFGTRNFGAGDIDSLVAACGFGQFFPTSDVAAGCVIVTQPAAGRASHARSEGAGHHPEAGPKKGLPQGNPVPAIMVLDTIYVHDPDADPDTSDARVTLGHLTLAIQRLLNEGINELPPVGRDGRPVTLHISHNWGGGVARWIEDFITGDAEGRHLVLAAGSDFRHRRYGQRLRLYALGPERGCIREWRLSPAIADTVARHGQYREILDWIIQRYAVGRVIVSSLIGHSLDALSTGRPTLEVLHDYYPAWPLLEHDPLGFVDDDGGIDLENALRTHGANMRFAPARADYWRSLSERWLAAITRHGVRLAAPGDNVAGRWRNLLGDEAPEIELIPHGFPGWPEPAPAVSPETREDGRLRLVIVGRMQEGKGLGLLKEALPGLRKHAHITLLGTGHGGRDLFGLSGVNIVYQYDREQLPSLLAGFKPHAALLLSTVAETWSYTLSELRSLGLVPIATRLGSFAERIRHGVDGWLIEPDPEALIEAVAELHRSPGQLDRLRKALPEEFSLAEMVAAYDAMQPAATRPPAPPSSVSGAQLQQAALSGEVAERERAHQHLSDQRDAMTEDLEKRTRWAETMERQFRERSEWAEKLNVELQTTHSDLRNIQVELQTTRLDLQTTRDKLSGQIEELTDQRDVILSSRSWRLTRPLRVAARVGRNLKQLRMWNPLLWPRLVQRSIHHLKIHGVRQALLLLQSPDPAGAGAPPETVAASQPVPGANDPLVPVSLPGARQPLVSVIIPVFNQVHFTGACLASLAAEGAERPFEVIVVDDCSTDATSSFLVECDGIRVINNPENRGFIHSCNAGARVAKGEYLVFLNNDTTVTPDWLDALIDTFDQHPRAGVAGARLIYPDGRLQEAGGIVFNDASGWNYGRGDPADRPEYNFASETDYVSGACLAIPRQLFRELAGFDPRYAPAYYEDTDLCFRVRDAGYRVIYQPTSTVVHHEGVTSGTDESSGTKRFQAINRDKFMKRWRDVLSAHPSPVPGPEASKQIRHARHRRDRGRMLVIDATTPQPDHDSGSVRMRALLDIFMDEGYRISFAPENLCHAGPYTRALQQRGVETLHAPAVPDLEAWLEIHGDELDFVVLSRHYVASFFLPLIRRHAPGARVIFDTVDLHFLRHEREAELTGSRATRKQAATSRREELALVADCDHTLVVSPVEQELLTELVPRTDIRVVSNIHAVHGRKRGWRDRKDLLFVGGFQHVPNVDAALWFAGEIMPLIREEIPEVRLHLIGSRMPPNIAALDRPGIIVHGFVAELEPYLQECRLSVAPLRYGAGVKGKVNEAMSHGLPVVATRCAAEGMFLEDGEDVLIADDATGFARQVVRAYRDETLWRRLSDGGLANVERYFSKRAARSAIQALLNTH